MSFGVIGTNDICILKLGFYEKKMCTETEAVAFFIPPPQYCYWGGPVSWTVPGAPSVLKGIVYTLELGERNRSSSFLYTHATVLLLGGSGFLDCLFKLISPQLARLSSVSMSTVRYPDHFNFISREKVKKVILVSTSSHGYRSMKFI